MSGQIEFFTPRVVAALMLREMSTTYGKSVGGYLWAFLEPIFGIIFLTFVFSAALRSPSLGNSFAIFYAAGIVPFIMYHTTQSKVAQSISFSKGLLTYPRVTFFDAAFARFLLNMLTQLVVGFAILAALFAITDTPVTIDVPKAASAIGLVLWLGFGLGVLNCFLFSVIPVWKSFWSIMTRPLFILSGLFYIYEDVPQAFAKYLWYNPLFHIIGMMRDSFYPTYHPTYISTNYVVWWAAIPSVLGLFLLRRYHKMILNDL
ncbi:MAG: ABC transporter permease [Pseudomonadota bacterium]